MDATVDIARMLTNIKFKDLPADVVDICKKDIFDTLAVAIAGSTAPGIPEVAKMVCDWGGKEESSLIVHSTKVPSPMAAFLNSAMGHSLDFDDTHDEAVLHAGVCTVPPSLALAERHGKVSGKQLILAVACGIEVMCRLGVATKLSPPETGWVYTSIYGIFGAAASSAKMLGLNEEKTINALGIAYSRTAGNMQCVEDGALTKRLQPAFAARAGLESALLAQAGITGARNVFEGKAGLYKVYHRDNYDRQRLLSNLGRDFELRNLSFKPYPCCRYTHPYIYSALLLRNEKKISTKDIESITVTITEPERFLCEPLDIKRKPRNTVDAQFSIPWTVAVALHNRSVRIGDCTPEALSDSRLLDLAQKVTVRTVSDVRDRGIAAGRVEVKIKGIPEPYSKSVSNPKGHPKNPMDWNDLIEKFNDCASWGRKKLGVGTIDKIVNIIRNLEEVNNVSQITDLIW